MNLSRSLLAMNASLSTQICAARRTICAIHYVTIQAARQLRVKCSSILHSSITKVCQPVFTAFLLFVAICTLAPLTYSQSTSASLTGLIDDPARAVIVGAQVTAINTETGVKTSTTSNREGQYVQEPGVRFQVSGDRDEWTVTSMLFLAIIALLLAVWTRRERLMCRGQQVHRILHSMTMRFSPSSLIPDTSLKPVTCHLKPGLSWATALLLAALFTPSFVQAQSTSASLTGLIDDPARAVIVGAQVTAINTETGVKTSTTSNREGQYVLPNLQPGSYRLEVDKPGFKGIIEAGLTLHVQDVVQIVKSQWTVTSDEWLVSLSLALAIIVLLVAARMRRERLVCNVRRAFFACSKMRDFVSHSGTVPTLAFSLLVGLFVAPFALSQSTSASLTGLIDDPNRALIQGASVTAINTETGVKTSTTSNREGQYVLPNLQPGSYRLEVDHPGFKGIIEAGLTLHVQDVVQIVKRQWKVTSDEWLVSLSLALAIIALLLAAWARREHLVCRGQQISRILHSLIMRLSPCSLTPDTSLSPVTCHLKPGLVSAFLLLLALIASPVGHAQSTSASLTGLIDDPQRAIIQDATVTAINTETGVKTSTKSNREGQYVLPNLQPGSYRLEVDHPGFKGIIEAGLTLHVQDVVQIVKSQWSVTSDEWLVSLSLALIVISFLLAASARRERLVCNVRRAFFACGRIGDMVSHSGTSITWATLLLLLTLFTSPLARAQSTSASLTGLIDDPARAVIVGAQVTAINTETGVKTSTTSNREGQYVLPNLQPGSYRLEVDHPGFKGIIEAGLTLHVQDVVQINFHMAVGSASETVSVSASDVQINKSDGSVSTVVDAEMIKNMPLNGRSFQDLILLTPGVVTQSPQVGGQLGQNGEFSVNGQRTEANYYTVDGAGANVGVTAGQININGANLSGSVSGSTALGTTQSLVSVDELQEFRVQSSTYSAEYGRNPGGQFAFETKSGTSRWHGSAYDYLRNNYFDANDWFNDYFGLPQPPTRQNDFGGSFSGPLVAGRLRNNRTFFFLNYEGLRLVQPQQATTSVVPDLCSRGVDASINCVGTDLPAEPALQPVLMSAPNPNLPNITTACDPTTPGCPQSAEQPTGFARFVGTWSNPNSIDSGSFRIDHSLGDRWRFFLRFSDVESSSDVRGATGAASSVSGNNYISRAYTFGADGTISSALSNEFRFNYTSDRAGGLSNFDSFGGARPANLDQLVGVGANGTVITAFVYNSEFLELSQEVTGGEQRQENFVDALSYSRGAHRFKFGIDYRRLTPKSENFNPAAEYVYFSQGSVETNVADLAFTTVNLPAYPLFQNTSIYAQDEWRVSRKLNLSMGVRWDINPAPGASEGQAPYTIQGTNAENWVIAPPNTPLWRTGWFNVAPRLGLAYRLRDVQGRETVLRAGGGLFFDTGQQLGSLGFLGPGFRTSGTLSAGAFPAIPPVPVVDNPPTTTDIENYSVLYGFDPHLKLPYTLQWNATVEQGLGKSQSFTVSYVASRASRLLQENNFQPTNNATYGGSVLFVVVQNAKTSDYDSLQAKFQRQLDHGLTVLASYTYSHCIDYGSENYNFGYQRGNCDFDVRHNLSGAFSYDPPSQRFGSFLSGVLNHWGLDNRITTRSSFPVTLSGQQLFEANQSQAYYAGLSLVPDQPLYLYGANCTSVLLGLGDLEPGQPCPGGRAINPNAFTTVSSGTGNAPRNFARGFGALQEDVAVRRDFPVHENLKLQFRADAFNLLNHPNFGAINAGLCSGTGCTFGQATATLAQSLGILSPLYQMGGPRSMQFALKLVY